MKTGERDLLTFILSWSGTFMIWVGIVWMFPKPLTLILLGICCIIGAFVIDYSPYV